MNMSRNQVIEDISIALMLEEISEGEYHEFSDEYKRKKQMLLGGGGENKVQIRSGAKKSRWLLIAASMTLLVVTGFAGVRLFQAEGSRESETGFYRYEHDVLTAQDLYKYTATPTYLPDGYVQSEGENKYYYIAEDRTVHAVSIREGTMYEEQETTYTNEVEELEINGLHAELITKIGVDYNQILNVFYEDKGYIVTIYATSDISRDEIIKIGEGIEIQVDESEVLMTAEEGKEYLETAGMDVEERNMEVSAMNIGEVIMLKDLELSYQVEGIQLLDALPEDLRDDGFANLEGEQDIEHFINSDGTPKIYSAEISTWDASKGELITSEEEREIQFVEVNMKVENLSDATQEMVFMDTMLGAKDEAYLLESSPIGYDYMPIYFEQTEYPGEKEYFFINMEANEKKDVRLIFAVYKQDMDALDFVVGANADHCYKWDL